MKSKLLIVNCPSDYFEYVPMGTFGLCDYLNKKNIQTKILNLSLYKSSGIDSVLKHYLEYFNATHVGLILHWQETAEGVLWVSEYIKSLNKNIKIICGGFTAGYFSNDLLEKCPSIDYIIKGDPEKPVELLLKRETLSEIPNLIYRYNSKIISNKAKYLIDKGTISSLSFSGLTYLYDHEMYIESVENKFGFPVFIGRGCIFNCHYCGGSHGAFRLHSNRVGAVVRSIDSIIADLKVLKNFTRKIYICYENDIDYIKTLFEAIKKEKTLVKAFHLNYGAWQLFDSSFLELYKDTFSLDKSNRPVFEISPEVFNDQSREKIKHCNLKYSINELKENLNLISSYLDNNVKIDIFFSRYHETAVRYLDMKEEITDIFMLKHELFANNNFNAGVYFDHLSTDVASRYWENYIDQLTDFDTLISSTRKLKAQEQSSFTSNNLCFYIPKSLSENDVFHCELLILILGTLEKYFHDLFHILFKCLGKTTINLIEEMITEKYSKKTGNIFKSLENCELLNDIKIKILQNNSLHSRVPFIKDLTSLQIRKAICMRKPQLVTSQHQTKRPTLDRKFISINKHDYLNLPDFLKRMDKEDASKLKVQRTVFIFLEDDILSMPYETYSTTIKAFEDSISVDEYYELMEKKKIFNTSYHKDLIAKLFKSNVLY